MSHGSSRLCSLVNLLWLPSFVLAGLSDRNLYSEPTTITLALPNGDGSSRRSFLGLRKLQIDDLALEELGNRDSEHAAHLADNPQARLEFFANVQVLAIEHRKTAVGHEYLAFKLEVPSEGCKWLKVERSSACRLDRSSKSSTENQQIKPNAEDRIKAYPSNWARPGDLICSVTFPSARLPCIVDLCAACQAVKFEDARCDVSTAQSYLFATNVFLLLQGDYCGHFKAGKIEKRGRYPTTKSAGFFGIGRPAGRVAVTDDLKMVPEEGGVPEKAPVDVHAVHDGTPKPLASTERGGLSVVGQERFDQLQREFKTIRNGLSHDMDQAAK